MKNLAFLFVFFPLILTSQNVTNPYFNNFYIDLCPNDTTLLTQLMEGWEVYQTENNEWDGVRDSTCINVREENNRAFIDLFEFNISKPLFVRSAIDESNKIFLDSNTIFNINAFFNVSEGLLMDITDQCAGQLCSGLITSIQIPDEDGTGFNYRINKTSVQDLGSCDASLCMATEDFEENYLREFVLKIKVDESSVTENAWIKLGGTGVNQAWEFAKIWNISVDDQWYNGTTYDVPFDYILGSNWWSSSALLRYHDGSYPNSSNLSYNEVTVSPNQPEPQVINMLLQDFYTLHVQPFTSLIGGLVEGSDSVRHEVNVINNGEFCLDIFIDMVFEEDTHYLHAGGHVELGKKSCMMFRNNGSLKVGAGETFYYGQGGDGMLALQEGGTIVLEENSTLVIDNLLVMHEQYPENGSQQIYMELNPSTKLIFGENARITNQYSVGDQMKLNIYMKGGELDDHHLSPQHRLLINKIYPTPAVEFAENIKIFPNPVDDELTIEYLAAENTLLEVRLISIDGKLIRTYETAVDEGQNQISLSTLDIAKGMYLINLSDENGEANLKMVKK